MLFSNYQFKSHWQIKGKINEVFDILSHFANFPNWWPACFRELQILKKDQQAQNQILELKAKGYLPYTLNCIAKTTAKSHTLAWQFWGTLNGSGNCNLKARGEIIDIFFDWKIQPSLNVFYLLGSFLKPIFQFDYNWAMQKGKQSLELELARHQAKTQAELQKIPKPPMPSSSIPLVLASAGAITIIGILAVLLKGRSKK